MFSDVAAKDLLGKHVIVGLTRLTHDGHLIRQDQYHGRIVRANRTEGIVLQTAADGELKLPPDLSPFFGARRGQYRLRGSGEIVADADLQTTWTYMLHPPTEGGGGR